MRSLSSEEVQTLYPAPKPSFRPWAQKRNFAKARLMSAKTQLRSLSLEGYVTEVEKIHLKQAHDLLAWVLEKWETQNAKSKIQFGRK